MDQELFGAADIFERSEEEQGVLDRPEGNGNAGQLADQGSPDSRGNNDERRPDRAALGVNAAQPPAPRPS